MWICPQWLEWCPNLDQEKTLAVPSVVYCCGLEAAQKKVSQTPWSHTLSSSKRNVSRDDIFQAKVFKAGHSSPASSLLDADAKEEETWSLMTD